MKIHVLVLVSLVICLSLIETKSTGKDNKTDLSDKTGPKVNCKKEIVFFLSVLRICATYRRILSSKSRVKNWAGLNKLIQTALYIADLNIPKGKLCSHCGCGSGKSGPKKGGPKNGGPKKDGPKKDGSGNEDSAQQGDSDNDHEQRSYQDFGPNDNSSSYNNDKESGVFDEDANETIHGDSSMHGDGSMHEEESDAPDTADFIRALRRHLEVSGRYRDERAAGRRTKRRPNPYRQLGHVCRYLSRLL
ncbi:uncharacterized protein LOC124117484 [Haliotis rufescens]|uniref:uncharacterized protein LOC124117484 n=1 Tax=Haliotis rufescens TaxID=6454 RepID=UPI00201F17BC|nr:uncharacterized protein LOC124117484 [Haliotis rufescens]